MSFVSISSCKRRVMSRVQEAEDQELAMYMKDAGIPAPTDPDLQQLAFHAAWGEHIKLKDQMPESWCEQQRNLFLDVQTPWGEHRIQVDFGKNVALPPNTLRWMDVDASQLHAPWVESFLSAMEKSATVREKYQQIKEHLEMYLSACKSLNEAVKHYPDLIHFVDDDLKERMNHTSGRTPARKLSAAEKVLQEIDTTVITSAAVTAKLGGTT